MACNSTDDLLESNCDNSENIEESEWSRLIKARFKEGFVEGKYKGGESTVQSGFDRGYQEGFALSYPISVIKGLLTANEILLKDTNPGSFEHSKEVKQALNEFEKKLKKFDLLRSETNENEPLHNENLDTSAVENENKDGFNVFNVNYSQMNEELNLLKEKILIFLKDCSQPLIYDQVAHLFKDWNLQTIPTNNQETTPEVSTAIYSHNKNF